MVYRRRRRTEPLYSAACRVMRRLTRAMSGAQRRRFDRLVEHGTHPSCRRSAVARIAGSRKLDRRRSCCDRVESLSRRRDDNPRERHRVSPAAGCSPIDFVARMRSSFRQPQPSSRSRMPSRMRRSLSMQRTRMPFSAVPGTGRKRLAGMPACPGSSALSVTGSMTEKRVPCPPARVDRAAPAAARARCGRRSTGRGQGPAPRARLPSSRVNSRRRC
jgi:hypothetical protein